MYIHNNNVSHRFHDLHHSVYSSHDLVHGIIGRFPSPNHERALTNGTIGYSMPKPVNDKPDTLVYEVVKVRGLTSHFHHHANL